MNFVLYNAAHANAAIKSSDGEAWIRLVGFFRTREEGLKYAKKIEDGTEVRIAPLNEFRLIMRDNYNKNTLLLRDRETRKYHYLVEEHKKNRKDAFESTLQNAADHKVGELNFSAEDRQESLERVSQVPTTLQGEEVKTVPEIRMQRFAAIACLPDYEHNAYNTLLMDKWEQDKFSALATKRNQLVSTVKMPTLKEALSEWVEQHPPPTGYNVYGQVLIQDRWTKTQDDVSELPEVQMYKNELRRQYENVVWAGKAPDVDSNWYDSHPLPNISGSEPGVMFLHVGETEDEVRKCIDNSTLKDYDIACVAMYEWIRVKSCWSDKVKHTYREKELAKLHENRVLQQIEADKLKLVPNSKVIEISA